MQSLSAVQRLTNAARSTIAAEQNLLDGFSGTRRVARFALWKKRDIITGVMLQ
jgi:hypothetical protein